MSDDWLTQLKEQWLPRVEAGECSAAELAELILREQVAHGQAFQADIDRRRRCGLGEVIYGPGKSPELIVAIANRLMSAGESEVLVTRVEVETAREVCARMPHSRYDMLGRTLRLRSKPLADNASTASRSMREVVVVCAGSTDLPVAREAMETLGWMGVKSHLIVDVGVAGPYRCCRIWIVCVSRWHWLSSLAWKARWPAWSEAWCPALSSLCLLASDMAQTCKVSLHCSACSAAALLV